MALAVSTRRDGRDEVQWAKMERVDTEGVVDLEQHLVRDGHTAATFAQALDGFDAARLDDAERVREVAVAENSLVVFTRLDRYTSR